jgi:hypothetical protein
MENSPASSSFKYGPMLFIINRASRESLLLINKAKAKDKIEQVWGFDFFFHFTTGILAFFKK